MKKLFLSILSVAIIAGSLFAFTGCNGKDYTSDIDDLKSQIQELEDKSAKIAELEAELAKLKNENASLETSNTDLQTKINSLQSEINKLKNETDLFTGSPKFNYSINETIPYYVNGTKIFDFKIDDFWYQSTNALPFTVKCSPEYSKLCEKSYFSGTLYDTVTQNSYTSVSTTTGMRFDTNTGNKKIIILCYKGDPFAKITATPTPFVSPTD